MCSWGILGLLKLLQEQIWYTWERSEMPSWWKLWMSSTLIDTKDTHITFHCHSSTQSHVNYTTVVIVFHCHHSLLYFCIKTWSSIQIYQYTAPCPPILVRDYMMLSLIKLLMLIVSTSHNTAPRYWTPKWIGIKVAAHARDQQHVALIRTI